LVTTEFSKVVCNNGLKSGWLDDLRQRLPDMRPIGSTKP
jgi:hypothetical protein